MSDPGKEQEYREEAERLAQLPRAEQAAIIAWHWDIASDPGLPSGTVRRPAPGPRSSKESSGASLPEKARKHDATLYEH